MPGGDDTTAGATTTLPRKRHQGELEFMRRLHRRLGDRDDMRIWRQNPARLKFKDKRGRIRFFQSGIPKGAADLTGIWNGFRLEIEVKSATGQQSVEQRRWERMIRSMKGFYILVDYDESKSMDENVDAGCRLVLETLSKRA